MGPLERIGQASSDVESAARSYGFDWNQDLLQLVRRGERVLIRQHQEKVQELMDAAKAKAGSNE